MKLYFMKKEALERLKNNLPSIYPKYFTETDNRWLWDVCEGDPFVEFKEVGDFNLSALDSDSSIGEVEFNNCKILYKNLSFLSESQAIDERLWAGLCHSVFYDYVRKRWRYPNKKYKSPTEEISNIKSRFFFSGGTRAGLYRNTLAKCWWVGMKTFDKTKVNQFEKLDIIGSNDISTKISDIFYSNTFASNPRVLDGIINGIKHFNDEGIQIKVREHIRPTLSLLNALGGGVVLDCLSSEEITEIFADNIYGIRQGDTQGVVFEEDDKENDEYINLEEEVVYVALGQKVVVKDISTGEEKIIKVDYLQGDIPALAKELLGKEIGGQITNSGKNYLILKIAS